MEIRALGGGGPEPAPCWRHLSAEAYRSSRIAELVREIEETAAAVRQETGKEPLGEEGVRSQDPETRPEK